MVSYCKITYRKIRNGVGLNFVRINWPSTALDFQLFIVCYKQALLENRNLNAQKSDLQKVTHAVYHIRRQHEK